ncbi:zinc finger protein ZFP2-like [Topomyia yanbarensis]|uniref:zinc finger protein ZFP2-like n=1 Tax=Topomyia yanbarensis TaxID=2498891 RepID=UPI00273B8241|nr:zinc finger protein ZFP2-like [Topomyia yanbarensis]
MASCDLITICCRCCLKESTDMFNVFTTLDEFNSRICDLITICCGLSVCEDDLFPKDICSYCVKDLANATRFRKRCLEAEGTLQSKLDVKDPLTVGLPSDQPLQSTQFERTQDNEIQENNIHANIKLEKCTTKSLYDENEANVECLLNDDSNGCNDVLDAEMLQDKIERDSEVLNEKSRISRSTRNHLVRHRRRYKCEFCDKIFIRKSLFNQHMRQHAANVERDICSKDVLCEVGYDTNSQKNADDRTYTCDICGENFTQASMLKEHIQTHSVGHVNQGELQRTESCDSELCPKRDAQDHEFTTSQETDIKKKIPSKPKRVRARVDRRHKCDICGKEFLNSNHLVQHRRIHTGERPHKCANCGRAFAQKSHLTAHMKHHTGDFRFKCDTCGKGFIYKTELVIHIRIHTGERPHKCDLCGKDFVQGSALTQHMRSHVGERLHQCEVCGKGFVRPGHLTQHLIMHSGERLFNCPVCCKGFSRNGYLTQHMLIHNGELTHKCDVCGKGFISKSYLGQHMRFHSDARPHQCEGCGKGFINKAHLKRHMRTHTGEAP